MNDLSISNCLILRQQYLITSKTEKIDIEIVPPTYKLNVRQITIEINLNGIEKCTTPLHLLVSI